MKKEVADKILNETENGYDLVAGKFSETRKHFWRGMESIGNYAKDGDNILDFGCGNGRLLELFSGKNVNYFGIDTSSKLIGIAGQKYYGDNFKFQKISSSGSLPFPDNFFNIAYSVAVFHHFPGKEYREKMVKELFRVLKPGGVVVITVWNLWQKKYVVNIMINWRNKLLGKSELDRDDCYITFKDNEGNIFKRYHHAFTKKELSGLFVHAGFRKVKITNGKNIVFIGKK